MNLSPAVLKELQKLQQEELDSGAIYAGFAKRVADDNRAVLQRMSVEEFGHAAVWKRYTKIELKPRRWRVMRALFLGKIFGFTFVIKLLERAEVTAGAAYERLLDELPEVAQIRADEQRHEEELMAMLDEERLKHLGAMVLGMNDALVELTGALAGFTFAMRDSKIVALMGLITGISATLSMTSSSYLSAKADGEPDALKSSLYTGAMYLLTVALMVAPFLLISSDHIFAALGALGGVVVAIILIFNYYISVAKDLPFKSRFLEMLILCIGVTGVSFAISVVAKIVLGIDIG